ncbi:unnamed protein product [Mytilus coruscus]|uniref:C-type lectin domain-containing protein n=1 Tax=Mytilus coruscus TaxID=42192 RepID=A0A6J8BDZ1_MYTCO|nr:unnamed protein product [Mytilus coruscus]
MEDKEGRPRRSRIHTFLRRYGRRLVISAALVVGCVTVVGICCLFFALGEESTGKKGKRSNILLENAEGIVGITSHERLDQAIAILNDSKKNKNRKNLMTGTHTLINELKNISVIKDNTRICRIGKYKKNNRCYYFSTTTKNWFEAQVFCQIQGGYLVEIYDKKENLYLKSLASDKQVLGDENVYFTGCIDIENNNSWLWDHSKMDMKFSDWGTGQPNPGYEHCVALDGHDNFKWHDYPCTSKQHFICDADYF